MDAHKPVDDGSHDLVFVTPRLYQVFQLPVRILWLVAGAAYFASMVLWSVVMPGLEDFDEIGGPHLVDRRAGPVRGTPAASRVSPPMSDNPRARMRGGGRWPLPGLGGRGRDITSKTQLGSYPLDSIRGGPAPE